MITATTIAEVRAQVSRWHAAGERVVFVPTMGNLHAGHVSLLEAARRHGQRFVASIFVNPMQFGPNEDFAHYPRTPAQDATMLAEAGCNLMFMPEVGEIYPNGAANATRVEVPGVSDILCGEFRPGHFEGVATIVAKLFHIVDPDVAIFGEKDFQQLTIIRRMVADLCLRVEIVGAPTVRESRRPGHELAQPVPHARGAPRGADYLPPVAAGGGGARAPACAISRVSRAPGAPRSTAAGFRTDYFSVRDARTLAPAQPDTRHFVVLAAARIGKARLIDNLQFDACWKPCRGRAAPVRPAPTRRARAPAPNGSSRRASSAARFARARRRIAQRHGDIAQPALVADAADGRTLGAREELLLGPREQLREPRGIESMPRLEVRMRGGARELVPRAHQLAVVAAVDA